nr:hypothetical protein GCM10020093_109570 [Planobispora longispora]
MTDLSPDPVAGFVDWYLSANPIFASLSGAPGYDRTLGDFTEAGILARESESRRWLERLETARGEGSRARSTASWSCPPCGARSSTSPGPPGGVTRPSTWGRSSPPSSVPS